MSNVRIRPAMRSDCEILLEFIKECDSWMESAETIIDVGTLMQDGYDRKEPLYKSFVAEAAKDEISDRWETVGYAMYSFTYSTWEGRSLYLMDLFVKSQFRRHGIGKKLWQSVVQDGVVSGCMRMDFRVSKDNEGAVNFFKELGALDLTEEEGWHVFTLRELEMNALLNGER